VVLRALALAGWLVTIGAGCSTTPSEPLELDAGRLTVNNRSTNDWSNVEIWLNRAFRMTVPTIEAGSRLQVPLDAFVSGYGQRFNFSRMQIKDLRLNAVTKDGGPVEIQKQFSRGALVDALGRRP